MTTPRVWDPKTSSWITLQGPQGAQGAQGPQGSQGVAGAIGSIGPGNMVVASTGYLPISATATEVLNNNANGNAAGWYRVSGYAQFGYPGGSGPSQCGLTTSVTVTDDSGANNTYWPAFVTPQAQIIVTSSWGGLGGGNSMNQVIEMIPFTVHQPVAGSANRVAVSSRFFGTGSGHVYYLLEQLTTS